MKDPFKPLNIGCWSPLGKGLSEHGPLPSGASLAVTWVHVASKASWVGSAVWTVFSPDCVEGSAFVFIQSLPGLTFVLSLCILRENAKRSGCSEKSSNILRGAKGCSLRGKCCWKHFCLKLNLFSYMVFIGQCGFYALQDLYRVVLGT